MAKLDLYSTSAKKTSTLTVPDKIFAAPIRLQLMSQAVKVYLANQRSSSARTKSRGEVNVTKAKVWRQKGTGRARHGSRNAPIFVGGAKAHGPTGQQNFSLKLSKQMKRQSLFSALSHQLKDQNIIVIDNLESLKPKTKLFNQLFTKLFKTPKKLLLLIDQTQNNLQRPTKNLTYLTILPAHTLTTYIVLKTNKLIFTKQALNSFVKHYGSK